MLSLDSLRSVIGDPELRAQFGQVAGRLVAAEIKAVRAGAKLSAKLVEPGQAQGEPLRALVRRHLDFYGDLVDRSLAFHQEVLDTLAAMTPAPRDEAAADALSLAVRAAQHTTVRSAFSIRNHRDRPITVVCKASPFVSEDGSQLVASAIAFDPPTAELQPGAEARFDAIIAVGEGFQPGQTYLATLSVEGLEAMRIVTRLTVDPAARPDAEPAPAEKAAKARPKTAKPARAPRKAKAP